MPVKKKFDQKNPETSISQKTLARATYYKFQVIKPTLAQCFISITP